MQSTFRDLFKIRSYNVGPAGFATPQTLLRFLQEAAANHAEILKIGGEHLADQDLMWVLSKLRLRMKKIPLWHERIVVETWPSNRTRGVRAHRDFRILNDSDQEIGAASSIWLLLSRKNRRPVRIPDFLEVTRAPGLEEDLLVDCEVKSLTEEHFAKEFDVCSTHLDFNNHVNNVCYLEWALNCLPPAVMAENRIQDILLNFLAEAKIGDTVVSRSKVVSPEKTAQVVAVQEPADQRSATRETKRVAFYTHDLTRKSDGLPVAAIRTGWAVI